MCNSACVCLVIFKLIYLIGARGHSAILNKVCKISTFFPINLNVSVNFAILVATLGRAGAARATTCETQEPPWCFLITQTQKNQQGAGPMRLRPLLCDAGLNPVVSGVTSSPSRPGESRRCTRAPRCRRRRARQAACRSGCSSARSSPSWQPQRCRRRWYAPF